MPGFIGFPELIVLAIVLLLIFGPKRLPEIGKSMGKGMREFKDSVTAVTEDKPSTPPATPELPAAEKAADVVEKAAHKTADVAENVAEKAAAEKTTVN